MKLNAVWFSVLDCAIALIPTASLLKDDVCTLSDALAALMSQTACIRSYSLQKEKNNKQGMSVLLNMFALFGVYAWCRMHVLCTHHCIKIYDL